MRPIGLDLSGKNVLAQPVLDSAGHVVDYNLVVIDF
jgi:hypothetical protein